MAEIKLPVTLRGDIVLRREVGRLIDAEGRDVGLGWGPENAYALKDALNEVATLRAQVERVRALADGMEQEVATTVREGPYSEAVRDAGLDIVRMVVAAIRGVLEGGAE